MAALEQIGGALLVVLVLGDVFVTVLYARAGFGIFSTWIAQLLWRIFLHGSRPFKTRRRLLLSFCGPTIVVSIIGAWALGLALGAAMVIHPALGAGVQSNSGETPRDFITAMYAAGSSLAIVGASNLAPVTAPYKLLYMFNSLAGMSVMSLTIAYVLQVYNALQKRNAFGLYLDLFSGQTGDAARVIAHLAPRGEFSSGYTNLSSLSSGQAELKEAHHFFPVLFYFRFEAPRYAVSRSALVALDTVTLIRTALADKKYSWVKESAAVDELYGASTLLLKTLQENFIPGALSDRRATASEAERWRRRYFTAIDHLRRSGVETVEDPQAGAAEYLKERQQWQPLITALAPGLGYDLEEIDPVAYGENERERDRQAHWREAHG